MHDALRLLIARATLQVHAALDETAGRALSIRTPEKPFKNAGSG